MAKTVKKATAAPKAAAKPKAVAAPDAAAQPRKNPAKQITAPVNMTPISISREQIALLAHRFWAERGHRHGHHEEDWYRAEQELRGKAS